MSTEHENDTPRDEDMSKSVFQTVIDSLIAQSIAHSVMEHQPVYTMQEAQEVCGNLPEEGVKVLFARAYTSKKSYSHILIVWTGNKQVDFEQIAQNLGVKKVKLANPEEVNEQLGVEIGALSPFGYSGSYPVILDSDLLNQNEVYINPGVHNKTIKMKPGALRSGIESTASVVHIL